MVDDENDAIDNYYYRRRRRRHQNHYYTNVYPSPTLSATNLTLTMPDSRHDVVAYTNYDVMLMDSDDVKNVQRPRRMQFRRHIQVLNRNSWQKLWGLTWPYRTVTIRLLCSWWRLMCYYNLDGYNANRCWDARKN